MMAKVRMTKKSPFCNSTQYLMVSPVKAKNQQVPEDENRSEASFDVAILRERVQVKLKEARLKALEFDAPAFWNTSRKVHRLETILSARHARYFQRAEQLRGIYTVKVSSPFGALPSLLLSNYYSPVSNDCRRLQATGCEDNVTESFSQSQPLPRSALSIGLPQGVLDPGSLRAEDAVPLSFVHVVNYAYVNSDGDVVVNNTKILPQRCKHRSGWDIRQLDAGLIRESPLYDEVFTIAQYWGFGFFHSTLESLPRLAPFLDFLRDHPHIKIHANIRHPFLSLLSIDESRVVRGNIRARILYLPAGASCGSPSLYPTQALASQLRPQTVPLDRQNIIVLIKRSRSRRFLNHRSILDTLEHLAIPLGFEVKVFADNPVLPASETRDMFGGAFLVVAPHGAGESNLLFAQPGAVLLEALCDREKKGPVGCYIHVAKILGMRYYGLVPKGGNCSHTTAAEIETAAIPILRLKQNGVV